MPTVKLVRSTVIAAAADAVWRLLRDFNSHAQWHPAIAASHMEADAHSDEVGAVRAFTLKDGSFLREQLIAHSDRDRSLAYCLLQAPIPLYGYVAHLQVRPVTDGGRTFVQWQSQFAPPPDRAAELERLVAADIYEAGFAALKDLFERPRIGV